MSALEELLSYKRQLERKRKQLTVEIDRKIQKINEALETVREAEAQLGELSDSSTTVALSLSEKMTVWEAMQEVMEAERDKWWRGAEMMRELVRQGYKDKKIASQISITFRRYSKTSKAGTRSAKLELKKDGKKKLYRLRQKDGRIIQKRMSVESLIILE